VGAGGGGENPHRRRELADALRLEAIRRAYLVAVGMVEAAGAETAGVRRLVVSST
jgi:hypothetical protein